jgi:hypothetical protein
LLPNPVLVDAGVLLLPKLNPVGAGALLPILNPVLVGAGVLLVPKVKPVLVLLDVAVFWLVP